MRMLRGELINRGDPDSLAAAALFERLATGTWHDSIELAARAAAAAPDRKDLALLQLELCYQVPSCNPESAQRRLRALDPDNGIVALFELARAKRVNDVAGEQAALDDLARSDRVDAYWTSQVAHLTAAVTGRPRFDQLRAFITVVGIDAAIAIPPLLPVSTSCSTAAIAEPKALARCRAMAAALAHADIILFESYGNHLAEKFWPGDSAQGIAIALRRRQLDYQSHLSLTRQRQLGTPKAGRILAALFGQYPTEQEAQLAWYARVGVDPYPPADWELIAPRG